MHICVNDAGLDENAVLGPVYIHDGENQDDGLENRSVFIHLLEWATVSEAAEHLTIQIAGLKENRVAILNAWAEAEGYDCKPLPTPEDF